MTGPGPDAEFDEALEAQTTEIPASNPFTLRQPEGSVMSSYRFNPEDAMVATIVPNPDMLRPQQSTRLSSMEIPDEAKAIIHGERAQTYGSAEDSFSRIAKLWSGYLDIEIDGYDVAMLMTLLKVSRAKTSATRDSFVDIVGYAALAERLAEHSGREIS